MKKHENSVRSLCDCGPDMAQLKTRYHVMHFTIGFVLSFFGAVLITGSGDEQPTPVLARASADMIGRFDTSKRLRLSVVLAKAGRSRPTGALDTLVIIGAIPTAPATRRAARPFRIRIENEPEATLLQNQYAPGRAGSFGPFGNMHLSPGPRQAADDERLPSAYRGVRDTVSDCKIRSVG